MIMILKIFLKDNGNHFQILKKSINKKIIFGEFKIFKLL